MYAKSDHLHFQFMVINCWFSDVRNLFFVPFLLHHLLQLLEITLEEYDCLARKNDAQITNCVMWTGALVEMSEESDAMNLPVNAGPACLCVLSVCLCVVRLPFDPIYWFYFLFFIFFHWRILVTTAVFVRGEIYHQIYHAFFALLKW